MIRRVAFGIILGCHRLLDSLTGLRLEVVVSSDVSFMTIHTQQVMFGPSGKCPPPVSAPDTKVSRREFPFSPNSLLDFLEHNPELSRWVSFATVGGAPSTAPLTSITSVPRDVEPGGCFICIADRPGETSELRRKACEEARSKGAVLIIADDPEALNFSAAASYPSTSVLITPTADLKYPMREVLKPIASHLRSLFEEPVIFISGASGKTTTTRLVEACLRGGDPKLSVLATLENNNGNRAVLRRLLNLPNGFDVAVIESGAHSPKDVRFKARLCLPTLSTTTSIAPSHLDTMGGEAQVLEAETAQYRIMCERGEPIGVVANIDDPLLASFFERLRGDLPPGSKLLTVSTKDPKADVRASAVKPRYEAGVLRTSFVAHTPWGAIEIDIPLVGEHNVRNALTAVALAMMTDKISLESIPAALRNAEITANRSSYFWSPSGVRGYDDSYNANPGSMVASLETVASLPGVVPGCTKVVAVLGDMENLAEASGFYHEEVGRIAAELGVSAVLYTGRFSDDFARGFGGPVTQFSSLEEGERLVRGMNEQQPGEILFLLKAGWPSRLYELAANLREAGQGVPS